MADDDKSKSDDKTKKTSAPTALKFDPGSMRQPARVKGSSSGTKDIKAATKMLSGTNTPMIVPGKKTVVKEKKVETGLYLDDLFKANDEDAGGFPLNDCYIFAGPTNTAKSYLSAKIARDIATKLGGKILWIAAEPKGVKDAPDYKKSPELFDFVYPLNFNELGKFMTEESSKFIGKTHNVLVVDSISEFREDAEYMPVDAKNMLKPLKERATVTRGIKGVIRKWMTENALGKRGDFIVIIMSHMKKITRPDSIRTEEVVLPVYKSGYLQSGYTLGGAISDMMQYLASYILVFTDVTGETFKGSDLKTQKIPTVIRVYPHKSRVTSRYVYKTFRVTDDGVVQ